MSNKSKGRKPRKTRKVAKKTDPQSDFRVIPGMVVYNEADRILGWLSRHPFHKRIVIIDQGSTDGTLEILKADKRVELYTTGRFEHFGEADFNTLFELAGKDAMILTAPDEFISEKMFTELTKEVFKTYSNFGVTSFYISRKNMVNGYCVNHLFRSNRDSNGKDWQLRISLGMSIKYRNKTHSDAVTLGKFAYLHDTMYITHEKTLDDEALSIEKRAMQNNPGGRQRDLGYLNAVKEFIAAKEEAADDKEN